LGGELTVAIKGGLRKSAKEVLEHTDEVKPCYRVWYVSKDKTVDFDIYEFQYKKF